MYDQNQPFYEHLKLRKIQHFGSFYPYDILNKVDSNYKAERIGFRNILLITNCYTTPIQQLLYYFEIII